MNNHSLIVSVDAASLASGSLAELFAGGALAVVVCHLPYLRMLWEGLLESSVEQLPWQGTVRDMAYNHYAGKDLGGHVGDVLHYTPYRIAYIARKFALTKHQDAAELVPIPAVFHQKGGQYAIPAEVTRACWLMTGQIMSWMTPSGRQRDHYEAVVHRLKYEKDIQLIERHYALAKSAVGRWAQLGHRIDMLREEARGPLGHKGISDLFAICSLLGPLRTVLGPINKAMSPNDVRNTIPEGMSLIGKPHYDGRYFSAMCGARSSIRTEAFDGHAWHELPIERDSLVIIPGLEAKPAFGLRPTLHRILHRPSPDASAPADMPEAPNVTLLLGARQAHR